MLNFDFLEKSLEIVSSPHFVYDFSKKMFLMLHSINEPSYILTTLTSRDIGLLVNQVMMS